MNIVRERKADEGKTIRPRKCKSKIMGQRKCNSNSVGQRKCESGSIGQRRKCASQSMGEI